MGTYHISEQRRLRRACVSAQSRQSRRCFLTQCLGTLCFRQRTADLLLLLLLLLLCLVGLSTFFMPFRARSVNPSPLFLCKPPKQFTSTFASNWQMPFFNQRKGKNGRRNYFMTNLYERILPDVRIEPATVRIPGVRATDRDTTPANRRSGPQWIAALLAHEPSRQTTLKERWINFDPHLFQCHVSNGRISRTTDRIPIRSLFPCSGSFVACLSISLFL